MEWVSISIGGTYGCQEDDPRSEDDGESDEGDEGVDGLFSVPEGPDDFWLRGVLFGLPVFREEGGGWIRIRRLGGQLDATEVELEGFGFVRVADDEGQADGGGVGVRGGGGEGGELGVDAGVRVRVPFGFARVGADLYGELGSAATRVERVDDDEAGLLRLEGLPVPGDGEGEFDDVCLGERLAVLAGESRGGVGRERVGRDDGRRDGVDDRELAVLDGEGRAGSTCEG